MGQPKPLLFCHNKEKTMDTYSALANELREASEEIENFMISLERWRGKPVSESIQQRIREPIWKVIKQLEERPEQ